MKALLAWYFVAVWGVGYVATKAGLQYAAPFTFLTLRFAFGLACLVPAVLVLKTSWPRAPGELGHLAVAGLLMHAAQLAIGLAGVALVVWHKIDIREVTLGSLAGTLLALAGVTAATLYQRRYSPRADLKAAAVIQFAATLAVMAPLALAVEGFEVRWSAELAFAIVFLVVFASILGVSVLNYLMRHGDATRVASMMYLPPLFAVAAEAALFGVVPSGLALAGIAITCAGVAMTVWSRRWNSSISSR